MVEARTTIRALYTEAMKDYLQILSEADHEKIMQKLTQLKELQKQLQDAVGDRDEALRIAHECYITALNERDQPLT